MNEPQAKARYAIYTRKSSEEGLDQSFNSLHAQREACEAYILSQKHEGWQVIPAEYDDGGFSGGNMERPGLKKLLADISAKKVDTVVVYKVDRLTRSLADFAKIVESFDAQGVSFVSVTQQFNTTTSMGRLTLNVLLSFAQFEREVTGERIRDKVAASKKKGMWMGGRIPLGYDLIDRKLIVNPEEAERVRLIFKQYLRLGSVFDLREYLIKNRICSKKRITSSGQRRGGGAFSRGALYHLLNNPLYVGKVQHKGKLHIGLQDAIIDAKLWQKVSQSLQTNGVKRATRKNIASERLLLGLLFDRDGNRFSPTHCLKQGRRYCYYTSQAVLQRKGATGIRRLPALEIEQLVASRVRSFLAAPLELTERFPELNVRDKRLLITAAQHKAEQLADLASPEAVRVLRQIVRKATVEEGALHIVIDATIMRVELTGQQSSPKGPTGTALSDQAITLICPFEVKRRGSEVRLLLLASQDDAARPIPSLVRATVRAREWAEEIGAGKLSTFDDLVAASGLTKHYAKRILRCSALSPKLIEAVLEGRHPVNLTVIGLTDNLSLDWESQQLNR